MTKQNPDILCHKCRDFDRTMNGSDGISLDVFVVCKCDETIPEERSESLVVESEKDSHKESEAH